MLNENSSTFKRQELYSEGRRCFIAGFLFSLALHHALCRHVFSSLFCDQSIPGLSAVLHIGAPTSECFDLREEKKMDIQALTVPPKSIYSSLCPHCVKTFSQNILGSFSHSFLQHLSSVSLEGRRGGGGLGAQPFSDLSRDVPLDSSLESGWAHSSFVVLAVRLGLLSRWKVNQSEVPMKQVFIQNISVHCCIQCR